ncbi:hypothetical protein HMN09_00582500 [Mycena chlorophos]|uniref:F-box domain-containing protein n=1 Tax=Mycena chlorophos TaxID=658473 RepID=A0A8H6T6N4_MYCCL|nr:hypothetical protein HMN09_00582500 [Mycena chlorophos]
MASMFVKYEGLRGSTRPANAPRSFPFFGKDRAVGARLPDPLHGPDTGLRTLELTEIELGERTLNAIASCGSLRSLRVVLLNPVASFSGERLPLKIPTPSQITSLSIRVNHYLTLHLIQFLHAGNLQDLTLHALSPDMNEDPWSHFIDGSFSSLKYADIFVQPCDVSTALTSFGAMPNLERFKIRVPSFATYELDNVLFHVGTLAREQGFFRRLVDLTCPPGLLPVLVGEANLTRLEIALGTKLFEALQRVRTISPAISSLVLTVHARLEPLARTDLREVFYKFPGVSNLRLQYCYYFHHFGENNLQEVIDEGQTFFSELVAQRDSLPASLTHLSVDWSLRIVGLKKRISEASLPPMFTNPRQILDALLSRCPRLERVWMNGTTSLFVWTRSASDGHEEWHEFSSFDAVSTYIEENGTEQM